MPLPFRQKSTWLCSACLKTRRYIAWAVAAPMRADFELSGSSRRRALSVRQRTLRSGMNRGPMSAGFAAGQHVQQQNQHRQHGQGRGVPQWQLQQQPEAVIVNVGSAFGSIGYPGFSGYCASKFGLRGFTEALKRELAASQVRVLYFAPRATDTSINSAAVVEMNQQLGTRMDSPDFVAAQLLAQLKSSQSRRFLGWPEQLFVRLNALFPAIVDKALRGKLAIITKFASQHP